MKTKLSLMALAAIALSSCSTDEIIEQNYGPEIQFSVVANKATRAQVSTNDLKKEGSTFKTMAYNASTGDHFLSGNVKYTGGAWKIDNAGTTFWPQDALNFYSVYPADAPLAKGKSAMEIQNYTITDANSAVDLLYATNKEQTKAKPTVQVNFRHALSQICFTAKNTNANLKITVKGIKVVGVNNAGTYALPSDNTEGSTDGSYVTTNRGTWTPTNTIGEHNATINGLTNDTVVFIGANKTVDTQGLFLLPQELKTWDKTKEGTNKAMIQVLCKIEQDNGKIGYSTLWPKANADEEYAWVAIPLTGEDGTNATTLWKEGKRYTYNIIFGEGAGWDPNDPNGPKPVLVPISFNLTVDGFVDANEINPALKPEATQER